MSEYYRETVPPEETGAIDLPKIEIFSDIHCPWAYLAVYRLRQLWPEYAGRLEIGWRSLSLEYINRRGTPKPILDLETGFMKNIEPGLPVKAWSRPDWQWPVTFWPAFEALNCAQAQRPARLSALAGSCAGPFSRKATHLRCARKSLNWPARLARTSAWTWSGSKQIGTAAATSKA